MASPPPPYDNITGISRTVMKDNAQETLGNYNGNARPGEIVMDLTQDPPTPYVGNNAGQLTLLTSSGSYGNTQVAQFLAAGLVGNITPAGNGVYSLGNATNYWSNLWVAANTLYIGGVPVGVSGNTLTVNGTPVGGGSTGDITFTNTTMSPPDGEDLFITAANSEVEITGLDFRVEVTDDVRITGNDLVSIRNTSDAEPITIITDYNGSERTWEFGADGTLETPGDIIVAGDISGTSGASTLYLKADPSSGTYIELNDTVDSSINTVANLEIRTGVIGTDKTWTFGTDGTLTAPGDIAPAGNIVVPFGNISAAGNIAGTNFIVSESLIGSGASPAPTISGFSTADFSGNVAAGNVSTTGLVDSYDINAANSITVGNDLSVTGDISGAYVSATGNIAGGNLIVTGTVYGQVANVVTGFETAGYVTATGNVTAANFIVSESLFGSSASPQPTISGFSTISATGNITGGNLVASATIYGNVDVVLGNIANTEATKTRITSFGASSYIQTGNGTVGSTGNVVFSPYSNTTEKVVIDTASGNVTIAGNLTVSGTAGNVVTKSQSSWTVPTGNSTQSFTVPGSNTYVMWVDGNIPNGIVTWNATVNVTNDNVPVVGQQFAWNYEGGGSPLLITSIPDQIVGTAGAISNAAPSVTNASTFTFGFNNSSGSEQTVRYGWTKISNV